MATADPRARVRGVARWLVIQGSAELVVALLVGAGWASQLGSAREEYGRFQSVAFLGIAVAALMGGILKVAAGRQTRECHGRSLGLAGLWSALLTLMTCYCFPTAAVLLVHGLRVYSDPAVREVFAD